MNLVRDLVTALGHGIAFEFGSSGDKGWINLLLDRERDYESRLRCAGC